MGVGTFHKGEERGIMGLTAGEEVLLPLPLTLF